MAQVTVIKTVEGSSNIIIRVNMVSDGTGELTNYPILSGADLNPPKQGVRPLFNIRQAWYAEIWFDTVVYAGTLQPQLMWAFARDCDSHIDFRSFGGIIDQNVYANPMVDDNGILNISTNNFAPVGSIGTLVLEIQKTNFASA